MADMIPPIYVQIKADVDQLKTGLQQAQTGIKNLEGNVQQASSSIGSLSSKLKGLAGTLGVAFGAQAILNFGKQSIQAASDFNEAMDKVRVVYGDSAKGIEEWSKTASTALVMSQQEALEAAGTYGNLFRSIGMTSPAAAEMSMKMVQLAADMASFNNASPAETLVAIRAGLTGEYESLKRLGVALNETVIKQKALDMKLIESTSGPLPQAVKAQAAYALLLEKTALQQGNVALTANGLANKERSLAAQYKDTQRVIGDGLTPVYTIFLKVLQGGILPVLEMVGNFLASNKEAMLVFTAALAAGAAAWAIYNVGMKLYIAYTKAGTLAQLAMNIAMKANPIGLIVTAVALLAAGFVKLWNSSDAFRKGVIEVGKAGLKAIGWLIEMVGKLVSGFMTLNTGPLRLLLMGLKALGVDAAGKALDAMDSLGSKIDGVFKGAADKVRSYSKELDKLSGKKISFSFASFGSTGQPDPIADLLTGGETDTSGKKKGAKKSPDAAILSYLTSVQNKVADAQAKYRERVGEAEARFNEARIDAEERLAERRADIQLNFSERIIDITKKRDDDLASLEKEHAKRVVDINAEYAKRLADIVQDSMNRLRSAFAQGTATSVTEMFKQLKDAGTASAADLLKSLQDRLTKVRELAANAAALAGLGFSQTFIEQVVAAGPEGNELAKAILGGDTETIAGLQSTFAALESESAHSMDALANAMYSKAGLATEELRNLYTATQSDLAAALAEQAKAYEDSVAEINAAFNTAFAEAEKTRDKALADAQADFTKAMAEANKDLADALAEASKDLMDSLDKIERAFLQKLATWDVKLKSTKASIASTFADLANAQSPAAQTAATLPTPVTLTPEQRSAFGSATGPTVTQSVEIKAETNATPQSIAQAALFALQYGQPLTTAQAAAIGAK